MKPGGRRIWLDPATTKMVEEIAYQMSRTNPRISLSNAVAYAVRNTLAMRQDADKSALSAR